MNAGPSRDARSRYRPEVDGLRAVAIVAVIAYHLGADLLRSGYLGVDIFFVISGYVITAALSQRQGTTLGVFLLDFYARRMKRLAPALATCVLITGIAISLVDPEPRASLETGIAALFGLSNLYLLSQASDYFGSPSQLNVFTQTWSLGVEEQFYLVFPFLVWFCGQCSRRPDRTRLIVPTIAVLSMLSISTFCYLAATDPSAAFYLMPARFWELGAGALCFLRSATGRHGLSSRPGTATATLILLFAVLFAPSGIAPFTTVAAVGLTFLLIGTIASGSTAYSILSHPLVVSIGRISYSLYLWHWAVISISRWTVGIDAGTMPFQIALILLLAVGSYRYVERPLREARWAPSGSLTLIIGATWLIGLAILLGRPMDGRLYTGKVPDMVSTGTGSLTKEYLLPGTSSIWQGDRCVISGDEDIGKTISIEDCTLGSFDTARRRVLVLGDSFSATFVQGFDELILKHGYAVTFTSSWGASAAPGIPNNGSWSKTNDYYWGTIAPALLSRMKEGDVVFLASDLAGYSPAMPSQEDATRLRELRHALLMFSDRLAARGIKLAVLHGNPFAREASCEPSAAIRQWFRPNVPCNFISREATLRRRTDLDATLSELQRRKKLRVLDLFDVFCPGPVCTYEAKDGTALYRDSHSHPSVEAMRLSTRIIESSIDSAYP